MGGALMTARRATPWLLAGALAVSMLPLQAQASTQVACLLMGQVKEVRAQPLSELVVRFQIQGVRDDNTQRNDVECRKQFKAGDSLWASLNLNKLPQALAYKSGDRIWLSYRYGDDRSGSVWRKYEAIASKQYMERRNGIQ